MDLLAGTMLRRTGRIGLPPAGDPPADGPAWVAALEADLADRGWLLQRDLRAAAAGLPSPLRLQWADWLLATIDELTGADRSMVPLFRGFPDTPPQAFAERLLTHLFATAGAPCVLCGREDVGAPLDPCGHLVCPACFPPEQYSACPICGRRLSATSAYLTLAPAPAPAVPGPPLRLRLLTLDADLLATAAAARDELVRRPGALSETDTADLRVLVAATAPTSLQWLPATVPGRETLALVIAWALLATSLTPLYPAVVAAARQHWRTATDAARTLWAYSGGDPGLVLAPRPDGPDAPHEAWRPAHQPAVELPPVRVRALPRPLRRAVLGHLSDCGAGPAAEDLRRHPAVWKRLGERLHPYERPAAAAVAFAALRETRTPPGSPLGVAVTAACAADPRCLVLVEERDGTIGVRVRTHAAAVEEAFEQGDGPAATRLLAERPGDLWRRLDHLLRTADEPGRAAVLAAARRTAARVAPGVLAAAAAELTGREATVRATAGQRTAHAVSQARRSAAATSHRAGVAVKKDPKTGRRGPGPEVPRRVYFPSGGVVRTWTEPETRPVVPVDAIDGVRAIADSELVRRAARLTRFDLAILDTRLAAVPAPMRERAGSAQLAGWPRGSFRELPWAPVLRLFLHWADVPQTSVDLDLSCAFFDEDWHRLGHCDYTNLTFARPAAVHSGDLTSAPPPLGATEFLDLDLAKLRTAGVRYAVPVVFSFSAIAFEQLTDAFAGFTLPAPGGAHFDAARVAQRFDLRGNTRMLLPMIADVTDLRVLWTDLALSGSGYGHSVSRHSDQLGRAAADQWSYFTGGHRTTVLDLAAWHAAGRADRIVLSYPDGTYREVPADPAAIRAAAAAATGPLTGPGRPDGRPIFAAALDAGDLAGPDPAVGSVALTITGEPPAPWRPIRSGDAAAALTPGDN